MTGMTGSTIGLPLLKMSFYLTGMTICDVHLSEQGGNMS